MATLPRLTSVARLVRFAKHGEHGRHWYTEARPGLETRAAAFGVSVAEYCDVLAITSPRVSVRRNVSLTDAYLREASQGGYGLDALQSLGVLPSVLSALEHWERTGEIRGPKTRAFSDALQGDGSAVVLDIWMARAFGIDQGLFERKPVHAECVRRVNAAARVLGWEPAEVQAAVWTAWYEDLGRKGETNAVRIAAFLAS